ncbi:MAG: hypothetical protein IJM15_01010, partial [Erysipelotrichaceae bacterium]|nr:hypothetical protein [Erysipelotrichaceae bacterium]
AKGTEDQEALIQIDAYLHTAKDLLDTETLSRDHYYGYVVEKCVDIYDYFGWFGYANELRSRVKEIYEGA